MSHNLPFFAESELILNPDGSIYHLHLKPNDIATTILTVGDPNRVEKITQWFDTIECTIENREFKTQTGTYKGERLTVISTGIGTGNIDIVLTELDALANINFETRQPHPQKKVLKIIRLGTSGSVQANIKNDNLLISKFAIGLDGLLHFYNLNNTLEEKELLDNFKKTWDNSLMNPYCVKASEELLEQFSTFQTGITATALGFYAPQGRELLGAVRNSNIITLLTGFQWNDHQVTNLEMETAAIYGLAKLLGHQALSVNAILANRIDLTFSQEPSVVVNDMIVKVLDILVD